MFKRACVPFSPNSPPAGSAGHGARGVVVALVIAAFSLVGCSAEGLAPSGSDREPTLSTDVPPEGAEGWSLLGGALFPAPLSLEVAEARAADLASAQARVSEAPNDPEGLIWVGRRHAYLGHYRSAIEIFTEGVTRFPDDPRFLRHRGHRWITLREFARARADLTRGWNELDAATGSAIEPDGMPNAAGIPLTTLAFNMGYHRALAEYLSGDFEAARTSWVSTLDVSDNADLQVAVRFWLYLTLRRLGDDLGAAAQLEAVDFDVPLLENDTYRDLLAVFAGRAAPDDILAPGTEGLASVTALHGLGIAALLDGDEIEARRHFQRILDRADQWAAFGYIAAEVEVARRGW